MKEEERAARLLRGQDTPSVIERERMAESVLERVGAERKKSLRFRLGLTAIFAAGAVAALLVAMPRDFTPRSGGAGVALEALCQPGPECRAGSRLFLRISNYEKSEGYLAAFARREDGTVIWYFPESESGAALRVQDGEWATRAVVLDAEHPPGDYEVYAVPSATPLDRGAVRALVERDGEDPSVVLRAKLRVAP